MKKTLFILLIFATTGLNAQQSCLPDSNFIAANSKIVSTELPNQNGNLIFTISITAGDSLSLLDSIYIDSNVISLIGRCPH